MGSKKEKAGVTLNNIHGMLNISKNDAIPLHFTLNYCRNIENKCNKYSFLTNL